MKDIISPVDTDDGLFHDGDPTTETEGTIVYARIMNDLQGATIDLQTEMKTILTAAGFKPDPTKENQLLTAIKKIIVTEGGGDFLPLTGGTLTGALDAKSTITVYEDDVNTVSEFLYSYKENGTATKKIGIKAICDADGAGHWVVDVNPAVKGDSRVQAFGIDGKSKLVTTMNSFKLYEGTERVFSKNNPQLMFGVGMGPIDKADAYSNIGQIYRVNATAKNKPPAVSGNVSAGVMCLPMDAAPSAGYFAVVGGNMAAYVGFSQDASDSITWSRLYTDKYKPTADDMNAVKKTGDTMTGQLIAPSVATAPEAVPWGAGAYADQMSTQAPFFQPNWQWPVNAGGLFVPIAKGVSTRKDKGYPGAVSFGYLMPANDEHPHPTIHVKGDSNVDCAWDFNPYSGNISSKAGTFATQEWVSTNTYNANNPPPIVAQAVTGIRLSGRTVVPDSGGRINLPAGCVFTGMSGANYDPSIWGAYSAIQVLINGQWATIGSV